MDQTELFKATVRTIRLRMRKEGVSSSSLSSSILPKSSRKDTAFTKQAKEVSAFISKLQEFLLKHRKDYIDSAGYLLGGHYAMTDSQRDEIDSEAQRFIQMSRDMINSLQEAMQLDVAGEQAALYRQAVCESLHVYLKRVIRLYSEQRAIRVKRIVDRKRISRLQPDRYRKLLRSGDRHSTVPQLEPSIDPPTPLPAPAITAATAASATDAVSPDSTFPESEEEEEEEMDGDNVRTGLQSDSGSLQGGEGRGGREGVREGGGRGAAGTIDYSHPTPSSHQPLTTATDDTTGLSEEERAAFALENEQLFEHMNTMVDEVRQIEGKVIEISKLQELFSEKVLEQAEQIGDIHNMTIKSSENVSDGNEYVKKAIKNRASFRIWILFVLLVLSFALLFLDWYS